MGPRLNLSRVACDAVENNLARYYEDIFVCSAA